MTDRPRVIDLGEELAPATIQGLGAGHPLEVQDCRRCGLAHSGLRVRRFEPMIRVAPGTYLTDWAMCPVTDAPVLLTVREIPETPCTDVEP